MRCFQRKLAPELAGEVDELKDWKQIAFLSVSSDQLLRWYKPGLLLIGTLPAHFIGFGIRREHVRYKAVSLF